jgi:hypothetical protein
MIDFQQFITTAVTMLAVKESAEPALRRNPISACVVAVNIYAELFGAEA